MKPKNRPSIPGSKPGNMADFIPVVQPVLVSEIPAGPKWIHEVKFDGYRMQVRINKSVKITSRNKLDWTHRFPTLAKTFEALPFKLIMDGEVVSLTEQGISDFGNLQADLKRGDHSSIFFYAFDLMHLDGLDLTDTPLVERKKVLRSIIEEVGSDRLLYSEHFEDGQALYQQAGLLGLEGVVSKLADSKYRPSKTWQKIKCQQSDELIIIGYVPSGRMHVSALRMGRREGDAFRYVGKVGTGFSNEVSAQLRKQLSQMHILRPTLTERLRKPDTKWVQPRLTAKIAFRGITQDGKLRHPSFKGLKQGS